ncbi:hypothetical protein SXCG_00052 [Synechococcus phage S-CAM8]|uniref:Uncharacterized protein n=1 Tax=Synechococcus phage S-CAM8 TaxID=754038 RepID=G8EXV1_9CAUD|nr:hypothetical protein SXCG_00052 [Synechococcus phage S-CAM8]AET72641.1 hypothetical protein SXFG_00091 [Synechococcus phage S-CAM8]AGN33872.1 hypothetical protein SXCG_00052 [Synechococcus phage S-CAM8]
MKLKVAQIQGLVTNSNRVTVPENSTVKFKGGRLNVTGTSYFPMPYGDNNGRPVNPENGTVRFNQTTGVMEMYGNGQWVSAVLATGLNVNPTGLLVYLDANNPASYTPGSNTWSDLSGNNNDYTLFNSPTRDIADSSIAFTSAGSQYASRNLDLTGTNQITVEVAAKMSSLAGNAMVFEHTSDWNSNSGAFGAFFNSTGGLSSSPTTDNWIHTNSAVGGKDFNVPSTTAYGLYSFVWRSGTQPLCYYNGQLITNTARTSSATFANFANATNYLATRGGTTFHGDNDATRELDIGYYRIYTRALSFVEINNNYTASKSQYGL